MSILSRFFGVSGEIAYLPAGTEGRRLSSIDSDAGPSRVRAEVVDPFSGLRGHEYLATRKVEKIGPNRRLTLAGECRCGECERKRLLPAIRAICGMDPEVPPTKNKGEV